MSEEKEAERRDGEPEKPKVPAAGPHARDDLTNYDATPGAGSLPGPDDKDGEAASS